MLIKARGMGQGERCSNSWFSDITRVLVKIKRIKQGLRYIKGVVIKEKDIKRGVRR